MKRIFSILLTLLFLITLFPAVTGLTEASDEPTIYGDFMYTTVGGNATIIGYLGSSGAVTIPAEVDGYPVIAFGNETFQGTPYITSVVIPSGVTSIAASSFSGCTSLTSVTIPSSVTTIGESAFASCIALTSITIPNSVTTIDNFVFSGCEALTSVTIPGSISTISAGTFNGCTALSDVTIQNGVAEIRPSAFGGCTALTSITIPSSVTTIAGLAFSGCSSLDSVFFEGVPHDADIMGPMETCFDGCAADLVFYYSSRYAASWAPNGETTWTEPAKWGAGVVYNIAPMEQLLGAQAYTDGSKFRFAFEIDRTALQAALTPGDTLQIGYNVRSKTNYEANGVLNTVTLPAVTWTAAMDAAETGTALKELLYTAYYGAGMRIYSADADSLTFALVITGMSNKQSTDIVFTGFFTTPKVSMRGILKYNSVTGVLAGTASTVIN